jgi:hypothetical protein
MGSRLRGDDNHKVLPQKHTYPSGEITGGAAGSDTAQLTVGFGV